MDESMENCIDWIIVVLFIPIAFLVLMLMALFNLLRFLLKAALLFIIVAIHTPIAVMCNVSIVMLEKCSKKSDDVPLESFDPRFSIGIEVQLLVFDFFKVIGGEFLIILSTGVITFYTAPRQVFYISMTVGMTATLLKWLNTSSLSKTAFSCLCDGYGLNPMMFFFSFMGLFDIGCHPIAKCSFAAKEAFLFIKNGDPNTRGKEWMEFGGEEVDLETQIIHFDKWNAFERGLFQLNSKIDFIKENNEKYILKSFMVLKLFERKLCEYPVERLELPEDYSKANNLLSFLVKLSEKDCFVADKMRGRYEHSLTLLEIVDGVKENDGYKIQQPKDTIFVVAGCTSLQYKGNLD